MEYETKTNHPDDERTQTHNAAFDSMPDFTRLRYFHGQMLVAHDLQTEQDYFREKLKLLNRGLEGYGTVCGLKVMHVPDDPDLVPHKEHDQRQHSGEQDYKQQSVNLYDQKGHQQLAHERP